MNSRIIVIVFVVVLATMLALPQTYGRPYRQKRVSDQRLAELETYMALRRMAGKLVNVPVGFGQVDPAKIGRRRRRSAELLLQELLNSHDDSEATADADAMLADNNESDEDVRDLVGPHRPSQQWLPEWSRRVQV
ncbi:uncharacterized protein [Periplaneta americana]|uniref:uncharacterized protein n=1 Tax=Periplaneta americana TaxID=6978 RepID=UPI0037E724BA